MKRYQRYWVHSDPEAPPAGDTKRRCARGERCLDAIPGEAEGTLAAGYAEPGLPFCRRDASAVGRALAGVPERYVHLRTVIGVKGQSGGDKVTMSRSAPLPVRLDVDALIRDMILILCSWDERIADLAQLTRPSAQLSRCRRDETVIPAAVAALAPRMDMLLKLQPAAMWRVLPIRFRRGQPPEIPGLAGHANPAGYAHPHAGYAEVNIDLDGAAAGLELLQLERRCRRTLGLTLPPPVTLDGIPCRRCEHLALEAAPEPQYKSACADCGDLLTPEEYRTWTRTYEAWARAQVLAGELEPSDPAGFSKLAA